MSIVLLQPIRDEYLPVSLAQECEERLSVVLPELRQFSGGGELAAAQLQGDLHAAVPDVVVVLHASCQRIPGCSIGGPILKLGSSDLARLSCEHATMVEAVDPGQVFEDIIIRSERWSGEDRAEDGVGSVVEWITGHQSSSVNIT